jgi:hypothetical protein
VAGCDCVTSNRQMRLFISATQIRDRSIVALEIATFSEPNNRRAHLVIPDDVVADHS